MKSALACFTLITGSAFAAANFPAPKSACLTCHEGIEPFVAHDTQMAQQIYALGAGVGDPNGCVVCHGGNPKELKNVAKAHSGAPKGNLLDFLLRLRAVLA